MSENPEKFRPDDLAEKAKQDLVHTQELVEELKQHIKDLRETREVLAQDKDLGNDPETLKIVTEIDTWIAKAEQGIRDGLVVMADRAEMSARLEEIHRSSENLKESLGIDEEDKD